MTLREEVIKNSGSIKLLVHVLPIITAILMRNAQKGGGGAKNDSSTKGKFLTTTNCIM